MPPIQRIGLALVSAGTLLWAACRKRETKPAGQTEVDLANVQMKLTGEDLYIRPKMTWRRPILDQPIRPVEGELRLPGGYTLIPAGAHRWELRQAGDMNMLELGSYRIEGPIDAYLMDFDLDGDQDVILEGATQVFQFYNRTVEYGQLNPELGSCRSVRDSPSIAAVVDPAISQECHAFFARKPASLEGEGWTCFQRIGQAEQIEYPPLKNRLIQEIAQDRTCSDNDRIHAIEEIKDRALQQRFYKEILFSGQPWMWPDRRAEFSLRLDRTEREKLPAELEAAANDSKATPAKRIWAAMTLESIRKLQGGTRTPAIKTDLVAQTVSAALVRPPATLNERDLQALIVATRGVLKDRSPLQDLALASIARYSRDVAEKIGAVSIIADDKLYEDVLRDLSRMPGVRDRIPSTYLERVKNPTIRLEIIRTVSGDNSIAVSRRLLMIVLLPAEESDRQLLQIADSVQVREKLSVLRQVRNASERDIRLKNFLAETTAPVQSRLEALDLVFPRGQEVNAGVRDRWLTKLIRETDPNEWRFLLSEVVPSLKDLTTLPSLARDGTLHKNSRAVCLLLAPHLEAGEVVTLSGELLALDLPDELEQRVRRLYVESSAANQ